MNLSILARHTSVLALAVILLTTATGLAQDAPLIIQPGTILTVRPNEQVSSDLNRPGDVFSGSLAQPVIVRGIVVAQRGQTVAGRVVEAKKAGMVSGTSRLGVTLTNLTLVDGQSVPISSHLVVRNGETSPERDAAAVAGTTGFGAAIGATADWGEGAAIGAGAGAAAGTIGVLLTRGHSTVIHPEMLLSFQVTQPVTIHTEDAPQAFRSVVAGDYPQESARTEEVAQAPPPPPPPPPPAYPRVYYYPPYVPYYYPYYPYYYPYYAFPYFYGPSFTFFFGGYPGYRGYSYYGYPGSHGYRPYYGRGYGPRPVPRYRHFHAPGRPH